MRTFFLELLEYEDKEEVYNLILAETSFLTLSNKLLNLFKTRFPNENKFEVLINKIQDVEIDRNKYIHSMYYVFSDKIYRKKHKKRKHMTKLEIEENMDLKSLDILLDNLFKVLDDLEFYRQMKIMDEIEKF